MDDHMRENDPNDYPEPGASSRNPYPAISQPTWGPYGSPPGTNAGNNAITGASNGSRMYPDLDENPSVGPYGASNEYSQLAEDFHMRYGTPQKRRDYHFPGGAVEYETDAEAEPDERPMENPYYDTELIRRAAEAMDGGDYVPTEDDASDDEDDDDDDAEFDASFANALDAISEDERAISAVTKPGRGRPRGRGRGTGRARGRGRGGFAWALKGTEHDPKLRRDEEKRRGRPSGKRTGPLAKKSKRRKRAEDPGPEFKKLQEQAMGLLQWRA
jgi:general transcription factor 3C polypeptide 3 (transcription factor C subunit 4)